MTETETISTPQAAFKQTLLTLRYDGELFNNHSIDGEVLAGAIKGFCQSLKEADKIINGEMSDLKVNVMAFQDGCFGTVFEILQSPISVKDVLTVVGFSVSTILASGNASSLMSFLKYNKGKPVKSVRIENGIGTVFFKDGTEATTNADEAKLLTSKAVRDGLNDVLFEPLRDEKAASVSIGTPVAGNNASVITEPVVVTKEDSEDFKKPTRVLLVEKTTSEVEKDVKFTKIHLTGHDGWAIELADGSVHSVRMNDAQFLHRCQVSEQKFSREDTFVAKLNVTTTIKPDSESTVRYEVVKVLRHRAASDRKII